MVVNIAIKGGLGNQLFQYALGSYIKQNYNAAVFYDKSPLAVEAENLTQRAFLLDQLFTHPPLTKKKMHDLFYTQNDPFPVKAYKKLIRTINHYTYISETNPLTLNLKNNTTYYLDGYWQNAETAATIIDRVNACTNKILKNNPYAEQIKSSKESAAVHIRRGDYVNNNFISAYHGNCGADYYLKAMAHLEEKTAVSDYFIFSDDLRWARENISSTRNLIFVEGDTEQPTTDLFLMKSCRHQVISNSSFSCWAAYLNTNPDKIVIAPLNWTRKEKTKELPLFKDTWTVI